MVPEMAFSTVHPLRLTSVNVRFVWTPDMESEPKQLKKFITNCVHLSPMDVNKPIHLHLDATTTIGMSYILCQPRSDNPADGKTIISCNSTSFLETQQRYTQFDCETLSMADAQYIYTHFEKAHKGETSQ